MASKLTCPICGSDLIHVEKKGFGAGKAIVGTVLTGNLLVGAAAGSIGKDKIKITCLRCGHKFYPGAPISDKRNANLTDTDSFWLTSKICQKQPTIDVFVGRCLFLKNLLQSVQSVEGVFLRGI